MRLGPLVRRALEQFPENLVMNRNQLEQTLAFGNGAPSQLVRAAQDCFTSAHRIFTECRSVFGFELYMLHTLSSEFWFHG
jgi:hypothetical protein